MESGTHLVGTGTTFIALLAVVFIWLLYGRGAFPVFVAGCVRIAVACYLSFVGDIPGKESDSITFDRLAWALAESRTFEGLPLHHGFGLNADAYTWVASVIYQVVGHHIHLLRLTNALMGTAVVLLAYRIATLLWSRDKAQTVAWICALHPLSVLYSSVVLREVWVVAPLLFALFCGIRYLHGKKAKWLFAAILGAGVSAIFHVGMIFFVQIFPLFVIVDSLLGRIQPRAAIRYFSLGTLVIFGLAGLYALYPEIFDSIELDSYAEAQSNRAKGRLQYLAGWSVRTPFDVIWQVPLRIIFLLYSPMLWMVGAVRDLLLVFDAVLWIGLSVMLFRSRHAILQNSSARFLFSAAFFVAVIFGMPTSNAGTAVRHRSKLFALCVAIIPWGYRSKRVSREREQPNSHQALRDARIRRR